MRKVFFLLLTNLLVVITCYAQPTRTYTMRLTSAPLKEAISFIDDNTPYDFLYSARCLENSRPVTINVTDETIDKILSICFSEQPCQYELQDKTIVLKRKPFREMTIRGVVFNHQQEGIANATVLVKGTGNAVTTHADGSFSIKGLERNSKLTITSIGYEPAEIAVDGKYDHSITLDKHEVQLDEVLVNGFQQFPGRKTTGSFTKINAELYNRSISFNVFDRIDGITSGLTFNTNIPGGSNQPGISIRGVSTINANANPLIVVDNFIYEGNLDNLNPNDIESITIAKDAAAASMWGAYSGNGVIIVTTKKGKYNQDERVSVTANVTIGRKPDLYYTPWLNSADYISIERTLFDSGYYNADLALQYKAVSPVVELLDKHKKGLLSETELNNQLNRLSQTDFRDDLLQYIYTNPVHQQYALNISGGNKNTRSYFSAGYDNNPGNLKYNRSDRITLTANNSYRLLDNKLEFTTGLVFTHSRAKFANTGDFNSYYPYLKLADENGNALPFPQFMRDAYTDTAGAGFLLDWKYRPLDEIKFADNQTKQTHYRVNLGIKYNIIPSLDLAINYQYINESFEGDNFRSIESYFTRNLINRFTQVHPLTGDITRPVPAGSIFDSRRFTNNAHTIRTQLNYTKNWNYEHELIALTGVEKRSVKTQTDGERLYGYDKNLQSSAYVDFENPYTLYYATYLKENIPDEIFRLGTDDEYISYYANATYEFKQRYTFYASARIDQSNLFGVKTNQQKIPLWSAGLGWEITRDFPINWLSHLRLKSTFGYTGNVDKTVSAYTTARYGFNNNPFNAVQAYIVNPPNEALKWERISITNFALDFAIAGERLWGSFEYYLKNGMDLIGLSKVDPTTGVSQFKGNTANIKGSGYELSLHANIIKVPFTWNSLLQVNHTIDKVTNYKGGENTVGGYVTTPFLNPLEGYPLYSIFSFKWAGLSGQGNPRGYDENGQLSENYAEIIASSNLDNMVYNGPATPVTFGNWLNTFAWKQLELSFNIKYKLGYYFRRSSIDYALPAKGSPGHPDFNLRWKKPGDENITNVPALVYPIVVERESFYNFSEVLIEKGDHIRLQDIQLNYTFANLKLKSLTIPSVRLGFYINNIGILWKATQTDIDPDFTIVNIPAPTTFAAFLNINF